MTWRGDPVTVKAVSWCAGAPWLIRALLKCTRLDSKSYKAGVRFMVNSSTLNSDEESALLCEVSAGKPAQRFWRILVAGCNRRIPIVLQEGN